MLPIFQPKVQCIGNLFIQDSLNKNPEKVLLGTNHIKLKDMFLKILFLLFISSFSHSEIKFQLKHNFN